MNLNTISFALLGKANKFHNYPTKYKKVGRYEIYHWSC